MADGVERPRRTRVYLWIIGGLAVAFGLFAVYQYFFGDRFDSDAELMAKLQAAPLAPSITPLAGAGESPQWRGPNRDGVSLETGLRTSWPKSGPPRLWKAKVGDGYSSLAVAGGRVFTLYAEGDNEVAICWCAATGDELWKYPYAAPFNNSYGNGPRSTPTVNGDYVYTVGATGILHCLKADSGKKVWQKDLLDDFGASNLQWGVSFSPLVWGDLLFTNPGGPNGGSLAALNKHTGKVAWHTLDDPAAYSSPMPMTVDGVDQVLFFTRNGLVSVAPKTGEVYWRFPWETDYGCNIATPIVVANYVFISSGYNRGCALLEVSKISDGKLQVRRVYDGTRMCNHFSTSVFFKDHLYGFNETFLTCMEFRTGKIVWKKSGFKKGSLLIADGHLIVLGDKGKLALAKATADGYQEEAAFQVSHNKCWAVPVLADGRLFVRDETDVYCFDVKKASGD
jgi:outer membrane protein assembly factor BamB